ncbi:MAG: insulinase family protein [Flavobacteriales bacterium]|nr:insulinase family protein [Flavobacteriales bacterium]
MKNFKLFALVGLLIGGWQYGFAQFELIEEVKPDASSNNIPYVKYKLSSNDLTLIIHEDHSDPIVHVQVAYHVGSARESIKNSGFAHFFEHMMFQGSKNVEKEEHMKIINEAGGSNNAFTSFDKTVYHNTAPSNITETMLWLEADRMGTHLDGFDTVKFNNQRDAVKNEKRQRYDNQPYGMVDEEIFKSLFPNHPYEWMPIGFVDDLDDATFDDLRNFFLRWYGPNNATLVVSGDVDPEQVKVWVNKYFGTIQKCPEVRPMRATAPALPFSKYVRTLDNIWAPKTVVNYPTVPEYHKDDAALFILSRLLGGSNNSILYRNLVKTEEAIHADASYTSLELAGFFQITVYTPYAGLSLDEIEKRINQTLEEFEKNGVSQEDLDRIKTGLKADFVDQTNSVKDKAMLLSHWNMMKGNGFNLDDEMARYANVTTDDVMRVFRKYVLNQKAVILTVSPDLSGNKSDNEKSKSVNPHAGQQKTIDIQYKGLTYNPPKDDFNRAQKPQAAASKTIKVPSYYTSKFDNGLKLIGSQSEDMKKVYIYFDIEGGHLMEADKTVKVGTASLLADLLNEGTSKMTTEEFSAALEKLGSNISFGSGNTSSTVYVEALVENIDATIELLKDALFAPRFDASDFKRIKKQTLESLNNQKKNPNWMASSTYNSIVYGKKSIMAQSASGDFKSVSSIGISDCRAYYDRFYSPNVTKVSTIGPLSEKEMLAKLDFLKSWQNKNVTVPALPQPIKPAKTTIVLVDKPYAPQSVILAGYPSLTYDYNGDYFKANAMNFALGGNFNSRLNHNLREVKGYTYGASSNFGANHFYGNYVFSGNFKREATDSTIMLLMKEMIEFKNGGIKEDELSFTKNSMMLSQALGYERPIQKLDFLASIIENDLPKNYISEQQAIINSLTVEQVNALARKYIEPEHMLIVVVGHQYKIKSGLDRLGYGKVKVVTIN